MHNIRRTSAILATAVTTLAVLGLGAPAEAMKDTTWKSAGISATRDTTW
jgi:hypothetical protein